MFDFIFEALELLLWVGFVLLLCLVAVVIFFTFVEKRREKKRVKEQAEKEALEERARKAQQQAHQAYMEKPEQREKELLAQLRGYVWARFGVELNTVHESTTQDEIIRMVNLSACEVATVCVEQDRARRGEVYKKTPCHFDYPEVRSTSCSNDDITWDQVVLWKKRRWFEARRLALQICPELTSRLPHFSEFEPLKSYREEHLRDKAAKAAH